MTQPGLLPIVHKSRQSRRLRRPTDQDWTDHANPERVFAAEWLRENRRLRYSTSVGGYFTLLEAILAPDGCAPRPISQRDAEVAAAVIQWLGTNCGHAFLNACEDKVSQAHERQAERRRRARQREQDLRMAAERAVRHAGRVTRALDLEDGP